MNGNINAKNIYTLMLSKAYIKVLQNQWKITFVLALGTTWLIKRNEMFSKYTREITYNVLCFTREEGTENRKVIRYWQYLKELK